MGDVTLEGSTRRFPAVVSPTRFTPAAKAGWEVVTVPSIWTKPLLALSMVAVPEIWTKPELAERTVGVPLIWTSP